MSDEGKGSEGEPIESGSAMMREILVRTALQTCAAQNRDELLVLLDALRMHEQYPDLRMAKGEKNDAIRRELVTRFGMAGVMSNMLGAGATAVAEVTDQAPSRAPSPEPGFRAEAIVLESAKKQPPPKVELISVEEMRRRRDESQAHLGPPPVPPKMTCAQCGGEMVTHYATPHCPTCNGVLADRDPDPDVEAAKQQIIEAKTEAEFNAAAAALRAAWTAKRKRGEPVPPASSQQMHAREQSPYAIMFPDQTFLVDLESQATGDPTKAMTFAYPADGEKMLRAHAWLADRGGVVVVLGAACGGGHSRPTVPDGDKDTP
jgi:hypothetical protein